MNEVTQRLDALWSQLLAAGDLIIAAAAGIPSRLAKGADNTVLKTVAGALSWAAVATADIANGAVTALKLGPFSCAQVSAQGVGGGQVVGNAFADYTGSALNNVPHNGTSKVLVHVDFSCYAFTVTAGIGAFQAQLMQDGVQVGTIFTFFYNTAGQHQAWSLTWVLAAPAAGNHSYKLQVKGNATNNMGIDPNDYVILTVSELGL